MSTMGRTTAIAKHEQPTARNFDMDRNWFVGRDSAIKNQYLSGDSDQVPLQQCANLRF
jgi:hypothetical protein